MRHWASQQTVLVLVATMNSIRNERAQVHPHDTKCSSSRTTIFESRLLLGRGRSREIIRGPPPDTVQSSCTMRREEKLPCNSFEKPCIYECFKGVRRHRDKDMQKLTDKSEGMLSEIQKQNTHTNSFEVYRTDTHSLTLKK